MIRPPAGRHRTARWHRETPPWWAALIAVAMTVGSAVVPMQLTATTQHAPHHRRTVVTSTASPEWRWVPPYAAASATPIPAATADADPSPTPTPAAGTPRQIAASMLSSFGWDSGQFSCLDALWTQESGWIVNAYNRSSGAYGIPQALPGSKMAAAGADWQTDAATQIRWGLGYIAESYGSPCGAWDHEEADGWY